MSYRFIEHTADIAVEVKGKSLEELFLSAAMAWQESVSEPFELTNDKKIELHLSDNTAEELLVNYLSELNYHLSVYKWIMGSIEKLIIDKTYNSLHLSAEIIGEPIDDNKHILKEEIKAVTFHRMHIDNEEGTFTTTIIFDI